MLTDPSIVDLVDPIRLLILLLPERWRAPAAVLVSALAASQVVVSLVVARLPMSARLHPRWGRVVRALHWYSVLRLRDEAGTTKLPGADTGAHTVAVPARPLSVTLPVLAEKAAEVAVSETRPPSQPGRAALSVLLAVALGLAVVLPVGAALLGCPHVREAALRATPGVPAPSACVAGAQRCGASDGGAVPEVCSGTGRWWPALARAADGRQRVCVGACLLSDAGVAYCVAADGGGR